ncbi:MAG: hypothetical protein A2Y29_16615, partial [Spirochaetes bacterium GWE2_31_10]
AYLEVIFAAAIWGLTGVFVKLLNIHPLFVTFFRVSSPAIALLAYFLIKREKEAFVFNTILTTTSIMNTVRLFLYFAAFSLTGIGNTVILFYTYPVWAVIMSALFLKEKVNKYLLLMLPVAFTGMILVFLNKSFSFNNKDFPGMICAVLSAILFAFMMILTKKVTVTSSNMKIIFHQNIITMIIILPFIFLVPSYPTFRQINIGIVYGILIGLIGFLFFYSGLKKLDTSVVSILSYFEIVSAVFFGIVFLGEIVTWNIIVGGLLIVLPKSIIILMDSGLFKRDTHDLFNQKMHKK